MTSDMKAAESFYKTVVGWTTEPFPGAGQPYTALNRSGKVGVGGILNKPAEVKAPPFWAMYIAVPRLEDAVSHITRLGGKAHTDVIAIPDVGRMRLMMDPQGAAFYIIEPASAEQRPEGAPEIGEASWRELMTTDITAAMKFYQEVFGWQPGQSMDMGAIGTYQVFDRPHGRDRRHHEPSRRRWPTYRRTGRSTSACPTWMRPPNASRPRAARFSTAPWTFPTATGS